MILGVFDSGLGGKSVANALQLSFPDLDIRFRSDPEHFPYANRTPKELMSFVLPILQQLADDGCEAIVIACNTVTTTIITELRDRVHVPLIGVEPMVKPAVVASDSKVITVCATPTTLASARYAELISQYGQSCTIIEPDCSQWSYMIEHNAVDEESIKHDIEECCSKGADVIVLACTHYHWIEELIVSAAKGRAKVLQPEQAIIEQVRHIIDKL